MIACLTKLSFGVLADVLRKCCDRNHQEPFYAGSSKSGQNLMKTSAALPLTMPCCKMLLALVLAAPPQQI